MAPRDTENNAYAKFWGDKQRALWYVMVFLEWSIALFSCCKKRPELHKNFTVIITFLLSLQCNGGKYIPCVQCGFEGALEKM